jgi:alpha/beta superfamily hydrolase
VLFVHGELDEFGDVQRLRKLVGMLETKTRVRLVVIPEADHFFAGHLEDLKLAIADWITTFS